MATHPETLTLALLLGSGREASNTSKVMTLVVDELERLGAAVDRIDPRALSLEIPGLASAAAKTLEADLKRRVETSRGVVMITPEYDGSYSAVMKILIEYLGYPSVLQGKPVWIIGVAAGGIGATRAIEHLRAVCFHIGANVLPGMTSVAEVHKLFDAQGRVQVPEVEAKLRSVAREFVPFVRSFQQ